MNELVKKWKAILEYSSDKVPALDEKDYEKVADAMEYYNVEFKNYPDLLSILIPQVRRTCGDHGYYLHLINGHVNVVTMGIVPDHGDPVIMGIPLFKEKDIRSASCINPVYVNLYNWEEAKWELTDIVDLG